MQIYTLTHSRLSLLAGNSWYLLFAGSHTSEGALFTFLFPSLHVYTRLMPGRKCLAQRLSHHKYSINATSLSVTSGWFWHPLKCELENVWRKKRHRICQESRPWLGTQGPEGMMGQHELRSQPSGVARGRSWPFSPLCFVGRDLGFFGSSLERTRVRWLRRARASPEL